MSNSPLHFNLKHEVMESAGTLVFGCQTLETLKERQHCQFTIMDKRLIMASSPIIKTVYQQGFNIVIASNKGRKLENHR